MSLMVDPEPFFMNQKLKETYNKYEQNDKM